MSWKGTPWDDVEVLAGKEQKATPGKKKTSLFGKCIYQAQKDNPDFQEVMPTKCCPPTYESIRKAFERAEIELPPFYGDLPAILGFMMEQYKEYPEFDLFFHTIQE